MSSVNNQNIRGTDGAILAQWVADKFGCVGPVGKFPMTGSLVVYTSGARGEFWSRGGKNVLTITNVGATEPTEFAEEAQGRTPDEFVAECLSRYLAAGRAAAQEIMLNRG